MIHFERSTDYVLVWDDDDLLGLWMLHPQAHTALLPQWVERALIEVLLGEV